MADEPKTILCHQCKNNDCLGSYAGGVPQYCQLNKYGPVVEASKKQYLEPDDAGIHLAAAKVLIKGGYDWHRIQQCIEFARELGAAKVGLAVCVGLIREGRELARYMDRAGLQVVSVACMIGAIDAKETGIPEEWLVPGAISCNPIAQAEIMNQEQTQLNMVYGLCVGHDTLFIKHSKAPVTYVAVKDMVTGNNPSSVLFSPYHRMKLNGIYKKA